MKSITQIMFVFCRDKAFVFVATKVLSPQATQDVFCRDKSKLVATKLLL